MRNPRLLCLLALTTCFLVDGGELNAQELDRFHRVVGTQKSENVRTTQFLRLVEDPSGHPEALETAITRYRSADNRLLIDLIAVIHIGEKKYYRSLQHQFKQYDALLYELVAAENSRVPSRNRSGAMGHPVQLIQGLMRDMLGLESQLQHIDYTPENFVHADLSPSQIQEKLAERGETPWSFAVKAMGEVLQKGAAESESMDAPVEGLDQLLSMVSDSRKLKIAMAKQFTAGDSIEASLGKSLNQLLITDRNQAAIKVLRKEIGKGKTNLALFYGAAHMPDFEKRLVSELGVKKTRQAWVEAWDLKNATSSQTPSTVSNWANSIFRLIDELE